MDFEIISHMTAIETIAVNNGIREISRLRKTYGQSRWWRKRKGVALVRFSNGTIKKAEIHWYEATGIGKREFKIKSILG
jgi:uncharacterized protein YfaT (DUF1175 family)